MPALFAFWNRLPIMGWWALWLVLGAATVALVVMLRTRWKEMRPLKKCAILSLWVHGLLACVATMVQIFSGSPGIGPGEPIRVTLLSVEYPEAKTTVEETAEETTTPDWQRPQDPPLIAPELEPLPPQETLADSPEPEPVEDENEVEQAESSRPAESPAPVPQAEAPEITNPKENDSPSEADRRLVESRLEPRDEKSQPPTPNPQPPTLYADRFAENREQLVAQRGGNAHTERAVRSALAWLAAAQSDDGRWDALRHGAGQERVVLGHDRHRAGANADTGISGLALLAFLGSGHTHTRGPYAAQIARGLDYLRRTQTSNGALHGNAQLFARTYCHSMATFAVCEVYALTQDHHVAPVARAATTYSLNIQNPSTGGWRYRPGDAGDTSQLGWQLMALKSAQAAQIEIPAVTWTRIERFLRHVQRGTSGGLAAYRIAGPASRTMTAEALFCRNLLDYDAVGRQSSSSAQTAAIDEAVRSISSRRPLVPRNQHAADRMNLYYWYYATLALHQSQNHSPAARNAWQQWNEALVQTLLSTQQSDGSWSESTVWGGYGGRVYSTALATLCLEVYYRYSPNPPPANIAKRADWQPVPRRQ